MTTRTSRASSLARSVSQSTIRLLLPKTGHVGVHGVGVDAHVHLEDPAALDAGLVRQGQDAGLELLVMHRAEVMEQGGHPDRLDQHDEEHHGQRKDRRVKPPPPRTAMHQPVRQPNQQPAERQPERPFQDQVAEPLQQRLAGQPVGMWADVAGVIGKRELQGPFEQAVECEVDEDDKEPLAADSPGQIADAG